MPVNDIIETRAVCQLGEQVGINVRHWIRSSVTGADVSLDAIAEALHTRMGPLYQAVLHQTALFLGIGARKIDPLPISTEDVSDQGSLTGLVLGEAIPRQVSGLITVRTAFGGSGFRGRIYIPFPGEADNDVDAEPTSSYVSRLQSLAAGWFTTLIVTEGANSNTFNSRLWRRAARQAVIVDSMTARLVWATQRRRGSFGRPNTPPTGFGVIS